MYLDEATVKRPLHFLPDGFCFRWSPLGYHVVFIAFSFLFNICMEVLLEQPAADEFIVSGSGHLTEALQLHIELSRVLLHRN